MSVLVDITFTLVGDVLTTTKTTDEVHGSPSGDFVSPAVPVVTTTDVTLTPTP